MATAVDLNLGDTQRIIAVAREFGVLRNALAYILATAFWETARTMKPVKEAYWLKDAEAYRKRHLRYWPWYGRGYVQLTWEDNYIKAGKKLGLDLTTDPDTVMQPSVAARILVRGMVEGWFTGKRLDQYFTLQASDWVQARRIINGTDKAADIASIARLYDAALKAARYGVEPPRAAAAMPAPVANLRPTLRPPAWLSRMIPGRAPATPSAPVVKARAQRRSLPVHAFLGLVALWTRIGLVAVFGSIADQGFAVWNAEAGTLTFQVDDVNKLLVGVIGIGLTFASSRAAKRFGLAT